MAVVIVCLWLGYHFYGRWLEKTWGIDPNAKTPAALRNDGKDYQPASRLSFSRTSSRPLRAPVPSRVPSLPPCSAGFPRFVVIWRHLLRRRPGLHGSLRLRQERRQVHGHDHRAVRRPLRPPALPRFLLALHASRHRRLRRHDRRNVQRLHKDRRTEHAQRCRRLDLHDLHRRRRDLRPLPEVRQALERPAARRRASP